MEKGEPVRDTPTDRDETFQRYRPLLFSIAYRMLGSVVEAEDVLQEAFLRWRQPSGTEVRSPKSYLTAVTSRLSIDHLRSAKVRREEYVGPWLPEPLLTDENTDVAETIELDETLSMAFLVLLEQLTPVERAVFLLREVFDYDYGEVARIVGKAETNCRQIARRARASVASRRPKFEVSSEQEERLMGSFLETCSTGNMQGLLALLSEEVILWSDGGGKTRAALNPVHGADKVARFFFGILRQVPEGFVVRRTQVNGKPGLVGYFGDGHPQDVVTLNVVDEKIQDVRLVVNPEKLQNLPTLEQLERKEDPE